MIFCHVSHRRTAKAAHSSSLARAFANEIHVVERTRDILARIASSNNQGSDEAAHSCSLARAFYCSHISSHGSGEGQTQRTSDTLI